MRQKSRIVTDWLYGIAPTREQPNNNIIRSGVAAVGLVLYSTPPGTAEELRGSESLPRGLPNLTSTVWVAGDVLWSTFYSIIIIIHPCLSHSLLLFVLSTTLSPLYNEERKLSRVSVRRTLSPPHCRIVSLHMTLVWFLWWIVMQSVKWTNIRFDIYLKWVPRDQK